MKITYFSLISGFVLGAAGWAIVPLVSDRFEPFDSDLGFYMGQSMLSAFAFYFGFKHGLKQVFIFILGAYISANVYPYVFGSSESRAWAYLALITTLALCILPMLSGILGKLMRAGTIKYKHWLKNTATKRPAS
ncbi:hypothetical protein [Sulfuriflexus mobilis]|uniref:hypothetical protein n=1 Tax=Sulfuriflexus mobilis TaxID=1811807 RepID=UPI000F84508E|nr:hypothetical protein [Sulfuriflexus mobilis]